MECRRFASRRSWLDPRDLLVRMTSAGDEGEGVRAATIRTAPRPQALGNHRTRTRIVSMVWLVSGALWSLLEMLGHDQPRDSHVHGAPHARAEPSAQLMQCEPRVCASRTATKYRNTTRRLAVQQVCVRHLRAQWPTWLRFAGSSARRGVVGLPRRSDVVIVGAAARSLSNPTHDRRVDAGSFNSVPG